MDLQTYYVLEPQQIRQCVLPRATERGKEAEGIQRKPGVET